MNLFFSREDSMYRDAIDTAAESADCDLVEDLLRHFVTGFLFHFRAEFFSS